jgi:hypothetical protein
VFLVQDEMGQLDDGGLLQHLRQLGLSDKELSRFGTDELNQLRIQGPTALVELAENVYVLCPTTENFVH